MAIASSQHARGYETNCEDKNTSDKNCPRDNVALVFFWKIAEAFDTHNGTVAAVAGIVVAAFTGTLWWVTWGMVDLARDQRDDLLRSIKAAEMSAHAACKQVQVAEQAFAGLERPYVFISELSYSCCDNGLERPGYKGTQQTDPDRIWYNTDLGLKIRNYGKSPAIVRRLEYALMHVFYLPKPQIEFVGVPSRWRDVGVIAADGNACIDKYSFNLLIFAREEQDTQAEGRNIFLKGTIIYEDVLGRRWERAFLLRLDPSGGGITEAGGSERNYEREVTDGPYREDLPGGPSTLMW